MRIILNVAIYFMMGVISSILATILFGFWGFVGCAAVWAVTAIVKVAKAL